MGPKDDLGEEKLKDAVDPAELLEGEDPKSEFPEDAEHWFGVYRELRDFKLKILNDAAVSVEKMSPDARKAVLGTDLRILRLELDRLESRLNYWKSRLPS